MGEIEYTGTVTVFSIKYESEDYKTHDRVSYNNDGLKSTGNGGSIIHGLPENDGYA